MLLGLYGGGMQIYFQDTSTTSIASVAADDILKIFPNPASEIIVVKLSHPISNCSYRLYDVTGRIVLSKTHSGNYTVLDVSGIASGPYWMRVSSGNFEVTGKVIIER
jgi:Secretion system C-terminal sorting domain